MIKTNNFIIIFFSSIIFFITYFSIDKFKDGDIVKYKKVYDFFYAEKEIRENYFTIHNDTDIWGSNTNSKREYYSKFLTSKEYIHFIVIYLFSLFLNYEFFLSSINFLFVFILLKILNSYNVNFFISLLLVFTNFYILNLYFSIERLKVGLIILLFFLYLSLKYKNKYNKLISIGLITACLAHLQMVIVLVTHYSQKIIIEFYNIFFKHKVSTIFFSSIFISLILFILLQEQMLYKLKSISVTNLSFLSIFSNTIKISIFYILSLFYSEKKYHKYITSFYFFIFLISFIIGGNRLIIVCFFFFLIFGLKNNRGLNFGVLLVSIYFLFKSYSTVYSYVYCNSLNFSVSECRVLYNDPYTRLILNYPNIWTFSQIHPSDPYYKHKFHSKFNQFVLRAKKTPEGIEQIIEFLAKANE